MNHKPQDTILAKKSRPADFVARWMITGTAFVSFAVIVLIFIFVFKEALPTVSSEVSATNSQRIEETQETYGEDPAEPSTQQKLPITLESSGHEGQATLSNLSGTTWQPVSASPKYGILPLAAGSFKVSMVAVGIAAPLAILAALFTAAFAPRWAKDVLKPAIEVLAGIPSVVIGFFALTVLATFVQESFGLDYRLNAVTGGVALSLASIPIIYTITDDAMAAIPRTYTEASLALGATTWQTALFVLLPAATPGIFAAVLLGIGRAFGETMIVLMATGNAALLSFNPAEPVRTMSATIGAEMAEVVFGETHYRVLFLIGSLLFVFTFTLNAIAEVFIRRRLMKRFGGTPT